MTALLLAPSTSWRERLLAPGVCGSRPPVAWFHDALVGRPRGYGKAPRKDVPARWLPTRKTMLSGVSDRDCTSDTGALVLAWRGAVVPEGMDRLARLLPSPRMPEPWPLQDALPIRWTMGDVRYLAARAAELGMGEVVTIDSPKEAS